MLATPLGTQAAPVGMEFAGTSRWVDVVVTVRQQHEGMDELIYPCLHCNRYTCRCDETPPDAGLKVVIDVDGATA